MESFILQSTHLIPSINFDPVSGDFKIGGRLISVSGQEYKYFKDFIEWITEYALNPAKKTTLDIDLEYCSSGGMKFIFQLFKILDKMHTIGNDVAVTWHYYLDDEDSWEKGVQFQKLFNLPFEVVAHHKDF